MWHLRCSSFLILGNGLIFQGHPRPTNEVRTWNLMWSIMRYSCAFDFGEYIGHMHPISSHHIPSLESKKVILQDWSVWDGHQTRFRPFLGQDMSGPRPNNSLIFFSSPEDRIWIHPRHQKWTYPKYSEISKSRFLEVAPSSILAKLWKPRPVCSSMTYHPVT